MLVAVGDIVKVDVGEDWTKGVIEGVGTVLLGEVNAFSLGVIVSGIGIFPQETSSAAQKMAAVPTTFVMQVSGFLMPENMESPSRFLYYGKGRQDVSNEHCIVQS